MEAFHNVYKFLNMLIIDERRLENILGVCLVLFNNSCLVFDERI